MKRKIGAPPVYPKLKNASKKGGKASPEARTPDELLPAAKTMTTEPEEEEIEEDTDIEPNEDAEDPDAIDADFTTEHSGSDLPALTSRNLPSTELAESDFGAISPLDPLRRFLEEVKRYPLLDPAEEFRLALRLRETGDIEAARTLVSANLRLVVKIAFEYRNLYSNVMDLIQEGNIGLMKAVSKFDPSKGARLGYYASWWIRSYILKYLLDNFRLIKIGTTQAQKKLFYHLMKEKERLEAQGLLAGPRLLAEKLQVREKDVIEMQQRLSSGGSEVSLDAPIDLGGERPVQAIQLLRDDKENAAEFLEREQLIQILKDHLPEFEGKLNSKELQILRDRLLAEEPKTLQEVADLYGLTRERARQIEAKVIKKLREFLADALGSSLEG